MRFAALVALALVVATGPAWARQCPRDMAKIDEALKTAQLSATEKADVEKFRKEGEELHKAGNHPDAEAALAKAKTILKVQ